MSKYHLLSALGYLLLVDRACATISPENNPGICQLEKNQSNKDTFYCTTSEEITPYIRGNSKGCQTENSPLSCFWPCYPKKGKEETTKTIRKIYDVNGQLLEFNRKNGKYIIKDKNGVRYYPVVPNKMMFCFRKKIEDNEDLKELCFAELDTTKENPTFSIKHCLQESGLDTPILPKIQMYLEALKHGFIGFDKIKTGRSINKFNNYFDYLLDDLHIKVEFSICYYIREYPHNILPLIKKYIDEIPVVTTDLSARTAKTILRHYPELLDSIHKINKFFYSNDNSLTNSVYRILISNRTIEEKIIRLSRLPESLQ